MNIYDALFAAILFYAVYHVTDKRMAKREKAKKQTNNEAIQSRLAYYRQRGPDQERFYDVCTELLRRGWTVTGLQGEIPETMPFQEMAAKADVMLQQTPYVKQDYGTPTEDRTAGKTTLQLWPRPKDEQNGDN